jgi:hypothetical protein
MGRQDIYTEFLGRLIRKLFDTMKLDLRELNFEDGRLDDRNSAFDVI